MAPQQAKPSQEQGNLGPTRTHTSQPSSDYELSLTSSGKTRSDSRRGECGKRPKKDSNGRWLTNLKEWFSTGEPSAHDWKELKKEEFRKRGIAMNDPQAQAKMNAPIGEIPRNAIKPSSGPAPEKALRKREDQKKIRQSYQGHKQNSKSISSGSSSSVKQHNPIAPWES